MVSQLNARHKPAYTLLTFYKFVDIPESELDAVAQQHLDYCRDIGLHGRVYIGTEGISSTVTGNQGQCFAYRAFLADSRYFKDIPDIDAKATIVDGHQFARLSVKIRDEIVTMGEKVSQEEVQKYHKEIKIEEFKDIIDNKNDEYAILDMRNDYEYRLGHFKGAIPAGTDNFREVPELLEKYKREFAGKKVIFYCTGGIRCEKASVIMNKAGMDELYSLQGGVVKYVNEYNDGNWLGNLYTFDGRVSTEVGDETTHTTVGKCLYTDEPTDNCENCRYSPCNARLIAGEREYKKHGGFCSQECYESARLDGFVKDTTWDKFDYKRARGIGASLSRVSSSPLLGDELERSRDGDSQGGFVSGLVKIQSHLDRKLANIEWRHATSQKETEIVEC